MRTYRNKVISNLYDTRPAHIINLGVDRHNEIRHYNSVSSLLSQDCDVSTSANPTKKSPSKIELDSVFGGIEKSM